MGPMCYGCNDHQLLDAFLDPSTGVLKQCGCDPLNADNIPQVTSFWYGISSDLAC